MTTSRPVQPIFLERAVESQPRENLPNAHPEKAEELTTEPSRSPGPRRTHCGWVRTSREKCAPGEPRLEVREIAHGFEASFSLGLVGTQRAPEEEVRIVVPPLLEKGSSLVFVHRLEDGAFRCAMEGRARATAGGEARRAAHRLWRDLGASLCHDRGLYQFSDAAPTGEGAAHDDWWCATAQPPGLTIDLRAPIGFEAPASTGGGAVLLRCPAGGRSPFLDVLAHLDGVGDTVQLTLVLEPFEPDAGQRKLIDEALRHLLKNGTVLYPGDRPVHDGALLERASAELEAWRREPSGFRLRCTVRAEQPVSNALLEAMGEQLFPGDPPLWSVPVSPPEAAFSKAVLDLRNTFPRQGAPPALLPSHGALASRGLPTMYVRVPDGLPNAGLRLGEAGPKGFRRQVFMLEEDRKRHAFLLGATGTGKSTFIHHMVMQDIAAGAGLCLLDPHGDLHDAVLGSIQHRLEDLVVIEVGDGLRVPGINLLEVAGEEHERSLTSSFITNEMMAIFDRLYDLREAGGPMFELYMRNSLLLAMENRIQGTTLLDVPLIFENRDCRAKLLENCTNPYVVSFWKKQAEVAGGEASLANIAPYVTSKLNQFTHNSLLRPIVGQAESTVDFRTCIDEGKVVLVNLAKGLLGELSSRLLGMLILGKLFVAAMARARVPAHGRRPFYVYIDEAQEFTTSTAAHMMAAARKFGLYLTLATQTLAQVSEGRNQELGKALLGNAGSLMLFRLGAPDAQKMESYMGPDLTARDLENLANFQVAARLLVNGRPIRPFAFDTPAPRPLAREFPRARQELLEQARQAHTRPVAEVEGALLLRREELSC